MENYIKIDKNNIKDQIGFFPNPIKVRTNIKLLNGEWDFSFDGTDYEKIIVPFCPESELSGVNKQNLTGKCFYVKHFIYKKSKNSLVIHFGAVDYFAKLFINGLLAYEHKGGYTPFECDITKFVKNGDNKILLLVEDKNENIFSGKQTQKGYSYGCFYSRITGIWQSVWLEERPITYIKSFKFDSDIDTSSINIDLDVSSKGKCSIEIYYDSKVVGTYEGEINLNDKINIKLYEKHLWNVFEGNLYYIKITFENDIVYSYFGLRKTKFEGLNYCLNNKPTYQKLVLNQGYYKKGIYTPGSLEEMKLDINNTISLGFNGLRLHQKIFDPKFLYLCDKAGLMVWGEFPSWGVDYSKDYWIKNFINEWNEVLERDYNHPSIVLWCPFNEIWDNETVRNIEAIQKVYNLTKEIDPCRPCVDVSGGNHGEKTDLYDFHSYVEPLELEKQLNDLDSKNELNVPLLYSKFDNYRYDGKTPVMLSEFGGIALKCKKSDTIIKTINECAITTTDDWGYGEQETNSNAFVNRYIELINVIKKSKKISGFCYTQLYDIEQEQNGFFKYDRKSKLTDEQIKLIYLANSKLK